MVGRSDLVHRLLATASEGFTINAHRCCDLIRYVIGQYLHQLILATPVARPRLDGQSTGDPVIPTPDGRGLPELGSRLGFHSGRHLYQAGRTMNPYQAGQILNLFLYSIPFWVPTAIGLYLVVKKPNDLSLMAGLLSLKPIVTTPIWFAIISTLHSPIDKLEPTHFLSILPGASLTLIIAFAFRHLFSGPGAGSARALLVLDCARWLNSFLISLPYGGSVERAVHFNAVDNSVRPMGPLRLHPVGRGRVRRRRPSMASPTLFRPLSSLQRRCRVS